MAQSHSPKTMAQATDDELKEAMRCLQDYCNMDDFLFEYVSFPTNEIRQSGVVDDWKKAIQEIFSLCRRHDSPNPGRSVYERVAFIAAVIKNKPPVKESKIHVGTSSMFDRLRAGLSRTEKNTHNNGEFTMRLIDALAGSTKRTELIIDKNVSVTYTLDDNGGLVTADDIKNIAKSYYNDKFNPQHNTSNTATTTTTPSEVVSSVTKKTNYN